MKAQAAPSRSASGVSSALPSAVAPAAASAEVEVEVEVDDPTLVARLVARDPRAATLLWRRFAPMVFRMLRRMLGPGSDIEDLAQEVFLCVFQKVPQLQNTPRP